MTEAKIKKELSKEMNYLLDNSGIARTEFRLKGFNGASLYRKLNNPLLCTGEELVTFFSALHGDLIGTIEKCK